MPTLACETTVKLLRAMPALMKQPSVCVYIHALERSACFRDPNAVVQMFITCLVQLPNFGFPNPGETVDCVST